MGGRRAGVLVVMAVALAVELTPPAWAAEVAGDGEAASEVHELIARSLEELGATGEMVAAARAADEDGDRVYPYIIPVGDFDGDGLADTVTVTRVPGESELDSELVLTARRGVDGAVLWTHHAGGGGLSAIVPTAVGTEGGEGLLVVRYNLYAIVGGPGAGEAPYQGIAGSQYEVYVTAVSAAGAQLWSYTGPLGHFLYTPTSTALAQDVVIVAGFLRATESTATDVLLAVYDRTPAPQGQDDRLTTVVLDGADGSEASSAVTNVSGARTMVAPAPDLDGDGLDDYTILAQALTEQTTSGIHARRGADGSPVWAVERPVSWTQQGLLDVGDVTGDGVEDLVLHHVGSLPSPYGSEAGTRQITLLDGATGAQVWHDQGDTVRRLGDVTGDGLSQVLVVTVVRSPTMVGLHYEALRADGTAWESTELLPREDTSQASVSLVDAGDADADGIPDFAHHLRLRTSSGAVVREDAQLISGRTGATLRDGPLGGTPLRTSVSGHGDDLVLVESWGTSIRDVTVIDGLTGAPLWGERLRARGHTSAGFLVRAADIDGDGRADLVVNASSSNRETVPVTGTTISSEDFVDAWVLAGRDGSMLWHSDPLVVPELAEADGRAEPDAPFTWEGAAASGSAFTWFLTTECASDNPLNRCDWLLVELANPPEPGEASRTATARVEIGDFAPVPAPVSDFDLDVYDSDEFGTRGPLIDSSASLDAVEWVEFPMTTSTMQPTRHVLVKVEYFTSLESGYRGTVTIG